MRNNTYSAEPQILDDSDEDFDPKTEDIHQYCKIIGLDAEKEPDLLWIAKEGILAKLEPPWKAINQEDVGLYYFNFETGDSMWEHPNDQYYRQKVARERDRIKNKHKSPKIDNFLFDREAPTPSAIRPEHASDIEMRIDHDSSSSLQDCGFQRFLKQESRNSKDSLSESTIQNSNISECSERVTGEHSERNSEKEVQSPRLAPLRTPRSQTDHSISNSLEFLKSSNDSSKFNLGKNPVLGSKSEDADSDEDDISSRTTSSSDNSNIQMDIGALQPAIRSGSDPKIDESLSLSETKDSETKDSDSSFKVAGNKFLRNRDSVPSKDPESYSISNASKSSSKHSKSVTSSHSRLKTGKMVPKINPTTASKVVNQSAQNITNMGISNTISVQIEQKKKQTGIEIEEEMKKVQLELLEKRQERYEEIMEAHESEMYRMEREAQKINNEQEKLKQDQLNELRNKFESEINEAIKREQEQHEMTKSSAINGLQATLERQKNDVLAAEENKYKSEIETYKLGLIRKNNLKLKELKDEIEREEKQKMDKLNEELLSKKHENERLANQDKEMFEKLRAERSKLEEKNKIELLKLQEEHNIKKQNLQTRNNQEFREVENAHLTKMKDLHLKFEAELNEKKKFLESKRKEFDTKIEKWERGHSQRKIAWAENSMRRTTELETEASTEAKRSQKNTPNHSFEESPMTREDLETSPKPKLHIPINQSTRQPASERLREYLKGLEKKLESVSTMVEGPQSGGKRWEPSHQSKSHMTSSSQPDYVSERWKAYFGQDFKYIPAKQELEQRTIQDYRYKQNAPTDKLREIIRTSSY